MTALSYCLISRALTNEDSFSALVNKMRSHDQFTLTPCSCSTPCAVVTREQVAELDRRVEALITRTKPPPERSASAERRHRFDNNLCLECGAPARYFGDGFGWGSRCEGCERAVREAAAARRGG